MYLLNIKVCKPIELWTLMWTLCFLNGNHLRLIFNIQRETHILVSMINIMGSILHQAQLTLYTGACIIPILHSAHIGIFPPQTHVLKLGNEFALPGAVQRKEEACSGANVHWCCFAVSEKSSTTDQKKPSLKSVDLFRCYYKGACLAIM